MRSASSCPAFPIREFSSTRGEPCPLRCQCRASVWLPYAPSEGPLVRSFWSDAPIWSFQSLLVLCLARLRADVLRGTATLANYTPARLQPLTAEIGRASGRESVGQYV